MQQRASAQENQCTSEPMQRRVSAPEN
jgi:hypothetical protein